MAHVAVTAFGADRPGIVATVTGVLMDRGGNLEDSAMTILGGHFAMMLMVHVPDGTEPAGLERSLAEEVAALGLTVAVRPVAEALQRESVGGSSWSVSVHGADRPGIVHRVTRLLAHHGANVVDLSTRVVGEPRELAYVLLLSVTLPPDADADLLGVELAELAADMGVEVHMRSDDPDIL